MFTESIEFIELTGLIDSILELDPSNTLILCDTNTEIHCLPLLALSQYQTCIIPAGEENKNLSSCGKVWESLLENNIDRNGCIVNLGGGVITDLGAFCASVYKRGISFVNVPTTYMAMVDAAVGGKTAIDFSNIKNPIGTFADPEEVLIYSGFLKTLPKEELINGFAESMKHALIKSSELWEVIKGMNSLTIQDAIEHIPKSLKVKIDIVEQDPFEMGERKLLNFGHTIGHAIEAYFIENNKDIRHGEAIAIGMYCEAYISFKEHYLSMKEVELIRDILRTYYSKKKIISLELGPIIKKIRHDKKNNSQGNNFTLLEKIGSGIYNQYIEEATIQESLESYIDSY